jgi:hypothetical protein
MEASQSPRHMSAHRDGRTRRSQPAGVWGAGRLIDRYWGVRVPSSQSGGQLTHQVGVIADDPVLHAFAVGKPHDAHLPDIVIPPGPGGVPSGVIQPMLAAATLGADKSKVAPVWGFARP